MSFLNDAFNICFFSDKGNTISIPNIKYFGISKPAVNVTVYTVYSDNILCTMVVFIKLTQLSTLNHNWITISELQLYQLSYYHRHIA